MGIIADSLKNKERELQELIALSKTNPSEELFDKMRSAAVSIHLYKKYAPYEKNLSGANIQKIEKQIKDFSRDSKQEQFAFDYKNPEFYANLLTGQDSANQIEEKLQAYRNTFDIIRRSDDLTYIDVEEKDYQKKLQSLQNTYNNLKDRMQKENKTYDDIKDDIYANSLRQTAVQLYYSHKNLSNPETMSEQKVQETGIKAAQISSLLVSEKGRLETNDFSLFEQIISPNTRDAAFKTIEEKLGEFIYPLEKKEAEEKFQTRYAGFANEQGISFEKAVEEAKGFDNLDNYMQGLMMADHEEKKFSQPDEAKLWFDEFQTILEADGIDINNPYALGLVGVIDDLSNDEFDELEGKKTEMKQRAQTVVKPAFIKWDKNGKNVPFDGKNYAEYIHENTEQISSVSDEKINYLYEMSKAGRLVVEHKDSTVGSINYHVVYTKNGMAMQINAAEFASTKKKTNYQELGLTSQEFKTIADRRMNVQDVLKNTTDLVKEDCGKLFTEKGQKAAIEEYSKYIWSDGKSAICHAGKDHPEWFDTKEHRALTNDLTIAGIKTDPEKQGRFYTASEKQLLNSDIGNYTNDSTQTCIEKLIKKTGSKDINDLMTKSILDVSGKLITGNSIMEFQQKIGKEVHLGNPFYIKPFDAKVHQEKGFEAFKYSVIGHGLSESSGKESYTKQMDQILAELHKTDSVFSKDSDEYKQLMTAFDTLKQSDILSGVNQNDAMFENGLDNNLKESLQTLSDLGKRYQEAHNAQNQTKDLSTRQTSRLIAINKLIHLNECIQSGAKCPVLPEEQFASRIVMGKAQTMLDSKNPMIRNFGKNLLTNREAFNAEVSELKTHSFFKNLSARADTVERCFRIDMKKVYSSFEQSEKNYLDKVDMKKVSALKETSVSIKNANQKDSEWTLLN